MCLYALVEAGDPKAIDIYLAEQDAQRALGDCLKDEPEWRGLLSVEEVELEASAHLNRKTGLQPAPATLRRMGTGLASDPFIRDEARSSPGGAARDALGR
jgi:hypothetical protein